MDNHISSELKLINFGIDLKERRSNGLLDTFSELVYAAPEVIQGHQSTSASDIWSCGVLMYVML